MKYTSLLLFLLGFTFSLNSQTVENIRVVQDGENLKINYRIGASTDNQLYNVFLTCSMGGGTRFEPTAVIGDVGENIVGGKSFYTIVWDVFEDVDEVVNPEFFVRVELVSDMTSEEPPATRTQPMTQPQEQVKEQRPADQSSQYEPSFEVEDSKASPNFERNSFFSFNFVTGYGYNFGISFGSLNNWGYYVTPLRIGLDFYDWYDSYYGTYEAEFDFTYQLAAGLTKHFVSAGFYRLHGYWGIGSHINAENVVYNPYTTSHVMLETGVINVLGRFNITAGLEYSIGYIYGNTHIVFGAGFVF